MGTMEIMPPLRSVSIRDLPEMLRRMGSPWGPMTDLTVEASASDKPGRRAAFLVTVRWGDRAFPFVAEAKTRSTPRVLEDAASSARRHASTSDRRPMVVVPYLGERSLDWLDEHGVSGIDLSGNGLAVVPGSLYLRRSGRPNLYPESQPSRHAYRGATSIVPRVFLCRREFESVTAIRDEIASRGGRVALSTVSKALARMVEDVMVRRTDSTIASLQPDALLDRLRESFEPPPRNRIATLKVGTPEAIFRRMDGVEPRPRLVLSGVSSQSRYAAGMRSDQPVVYCEDLGEVRRRAGDTWNETERFADLTVIETRDRTPFFDARADPSGVVYASPVQAFLELAAGDKRDREMAAGVRRSILDAIG